MKTPNQVVPQNTFQAKASDDQSGQLFNALGNALSGASGMFGKKDDFASLLGPDINTNRGISFPSRGLGNQ